MSDEEPAEEPVEDVADEAGPTEEYASDADPTEGAVDEPVEEPEEERDPLEVALERAEFAEKEIAYKEAEIQNVRKRLMADKAEAIQYGGMGMERVYAREKETAEPA